MDHPSLTLDLGTVGALTATDLGGRVNLARYDPAGTLRAGALVKDLPGLCAALDHGGRHGPSGTLVIAADHGEIDVLLPVPRPGRVQDIYIATRLTQADAHDLVTFVMNAQQHAPGSRSRLRAA